VVSVQLGGSREEAVVVRVAYLVHGSYGWDNLVMEQGHQLPGLALLLAVRIQHVLLCVFNVFCI